MKDSQFLNLPQKCTGIHGIIFITEHMHYHLKLAYVAEELSTIPRNLGKF